LSGLDIVGISIPVTVLVAIIGDLLFAHPVTVIVDAITHLHGAGMDLSVFIIAVAVDCRVAISVQIVLLRTGFLPGKEQIHKHQKTKPAPSLHLIPPSSPMGLVGS